MRTKPCPTQNTNRVGRNSEMRAWVWLADQGFEVFSDVTPNGPVNCVAIDLKTREVLLISIRTLSFNTKYPKYSSWGKLTDEQLLLGVRLLIVPKQGDDIIFLTAEESLANPSNPAGLKKLRPGNDFDEGLLLT